MQYGLTPERVAGLFVRLVFPGQAAARLLGVDGLNERQTLGDIPADATLVSMEFNVFRVEDRRIGVALRND